MVLILLPLLARQRSPKGFNQLPVSPRAMDETRAGRGGPRRYFSTKARSKT
jgi:hypothetical protein